MDEISRDELVLLDQVRSGDAQAFGEIWQLYHGKLTGYVYLRAPYLDPEDVASTVLESTLLATIHGHGPAKSVWSYLARAARGEIAQRALEVGKRTTLYDDEYEIAVVDDRMDSVDMLNDVLATFSQTDQLIIREAFSKSTKAGEIARAVGRDVAWTSRRIYKLRSRLQERWVQAHVKTETAPAECAKVLSHAGAVLSQRARSTTSQKFWTHVYSCGYCKQTVEGVQIDSRRLASVFPTLGIGAAVAAHSVGTVGEAGTHLLSANAGLGLSGPLTGIVAKAGSSAAAALLVGSVLIPAVETANAPSTVSQTERSNTHPIAKERPSVEGGSNSSNESDEPLLPSTTWIRTSVILSSRTIDGRRPTEGPRSGCVNSGGQQFDEPTNPNCGRPERWTSDDKQGTRPSRNVKSESHDSIPRGLPAKPATSGPATDARPSHQSDFEGEEPPVPTTTTAPSPGLDTTTDVTAPEDSGSASPSIQPTEQSAIGGECVAELVDGKAVQHCYD